MSSHIHPAGTRQPGEREVFLVDGCERCAEFDDYDAGNGPEQCVHTYRQGPAGMLLGAHWPLEKARTEIAERGVDLAGPVMTGMRHGLVLEDETGAVFFATKDAEA